MPEEPDELRALLEAQLAIRFPTLRTTPTARKPSEHRYNLHKVSLEEFLELPFGGSVGEIADVESAALGSAGKVGVVGLFVGLASDVGAGQSGGHVVNGSVRNFVISRGRHVGRADWGLLMAERLGSWSENEDDGVGSFRPLS